MKPGHDEDAAALQLRAMAAVRRTFRPDRLFDQWLGQHPAATQQEQYRAADAVFELQDIARPMTDHDGAKAFSLPDDTRLPILAQLGAEVAQRLLADIPAPEVTASERMLGTWLATGPVGMQDDYAQLSTMQSVSRWAAALGAEVPVAPEAIGERLRRLDFMQALGGADLPRFVGREAILHRLHDAWRSTSGTLTWVGLEGPGGIGKSLTVTRFIRDLLDRNDEDRPSAVYHLDFDRVLLQQAQPLTIWRELIRQSAAWCDQRDLNQLDEMVQRLASGGHALESSSDMQRSTQHNMWQIGSSLMHLIANNRPARIILFVDSFEQVAGYDDVAADSPTEVARTLERIGASVLVICASRTFRHVNLELPERSMIRLQMEQFSADEAEHYLVTEAARAGIAISREEAQAVQAVAGRSPLALRLAVALLEKGDPVDGDVAWHKRIDRSPEFVQAALYERLLRRIRSPELRKIAAPGLLVRRLTEEVIREVLAVPCGLDLAAHPAASLMNAARREGQLFTDRADDPGALWHRQDVRATMLDNVRRMTPRPLADQIHQHAVAYYAHSPEDQIARVEELYHRLCLDQDADQLDRRWSRPAGLALHGCLDELPARAQRYLRSRLGAATGRADGGERDTQSGERSLLGRKRLQTSGSTVEILEAWHAAGERLDGPLGDLFAAALLKDGRHDTVLAGAAELSRMDAERLDRKAAAGVMRMAAAVLEGRDALDAARAYWSFGLALGKSGRDRAGELAARIGLMRVIRKLQRTPPGKHRQPVKALALLEKVFPELQRQKVLAREVGAELGCWTDPKGGLHPAVAKLIHEVIESNEAFPSVVDNDARMAELSQRFLGARSNTSIRNLNSIALRILHSSHEQLGMLLATLAEEVDLTLVRGAWPQPVARDT